MYITWSNRRHKLAVNMYILRIYKALLLMTTDTSAYQNQTGQRQASCVYNRPRQNGKTILPKGFLLTDKEQLLRQIDYRPNQSAACHLLKPRHGHTKRTNFTKLCNHLNSASDFHLTIISLYIDNCDHRNNVYLLKHFTVSASAFI